MNFKSIRRLSLISLALSLNMTIALGLLNQPLLAMVAVIQLIASLFAVSWITENDPSRIQWVPVDAITPWPTSQSTLPRIDPSMI